MKTYEVFVSEKIYFRYEIEAENAEEAKAKAIAEFESSEPNDWFDSDGGHIESVEEQ